ncbi:MAG: arsenate reductase ArsC, partial [Planctomycetota bacterium]
MKQTAKRYLVLCTGNRCRSQMAHGWLAHLGGDTVEVYSAGTQPKGVHPLSIEFMHDAGIDIGHHTSDHVSAYLDQDFDAVVTVCDHAKEACPVFPGAGR